MSKVRMEYGTKEQREQKQDKAVLREEIASHTESFLDNGGEITCVPRGATGIVLSKKTRI